MSGMDILAGVHNPPPRSSPLHIFTILRVPTLCTVSWHTTRPKNRNVPPIVMNARRNWPSPEETDGFAKPLERRLQVAGIFLTGSRGDVVDRGTRRPGGGTEPSTLQGFPTRKRDRHTPGRPAPTTLSVDGNATGIAIRIGQHLSTYGEPRERLPRQGLLTCSRLTETASIRQVNWRRHPVSLALRKLILLRVVRVDSP
jgi:hypothetical protein